MQQSKGPEVGCLQVTFVECQNKCTKENNKQSFPSSRKGCNFFGWLSICFTRHLRHKKWKLIRSEPSSALQIPPNLLQASNLTGGNRQKAYAAVPGAGPALPTSCTAAATAAQPHADQERGRGSSRDAGAARLSRLISAASDPGPHLTSARRCLAPPGTVGRRYPSLAPPALPHRRSPRPPVQGRAQHHTRRAPGTDDLAQPPRRLRARGRVRGRDGAALRPRGRVRGQDGAALRPSHFPPSRKAGPPLRFLRKPVQGLVSLRPSVAARRLPAACPVPHRCPGPLSRGLGGR